MGRAPAGGTQKEKAMNIANKTVLITGANRGIGRALVDEALRRGAGRVYAGTRGTIQHPDPRVIPITLDVTNPSQVARAAKEIETLDILINNAGIAIYDDLTNADVIGQHLAVNALGPLKVTLAMLPQLKRARGAIVNNLSIASLAPLPVIPGYSISKAAAFSMTQSLRALLASDGVKVHAVFIGPTDTDMSKDFDTAKASPASVAIGIFEGLERGDEDIFPDPASGPMANGWNTGVAKILEREFAAFVPQA
jgi:NAD(P)-dependent dehydrogenase (short-subunit alcohol dehydrogenase family)